MAAEHKEENNSNFEFTEEGLKEAGDYIKTEQNQGRIPESRAIVAYATMKKKEVNNIIPFDEKDKLKDIALYYIFRLYNGNITNKDIQYYRSLNNKDKKEYVQSLLNIYHKRDITLHNNEAYWNNISTKVQKKINKLFGPDELTGGKPQKTLTPGKLRKSATSKQLRDIAKSLNLKVSSSQSGGYLNKTQLSKSISKALRKSKKTHKTHKTKS